MTPSAELRLEPLDPGRFREFWSLFQAALPASADEVAAELGISRTDYERLPQETGELFQVESAGEVAGYVWLEVRGVTLHLHALLLHPTYQHQGLGRRILDMILHRYGALVDLIELGVEPENTAARRLYERAGFAYVGERSGFLIMRRDVRAEASTSH